MFNQTIKKARFSHMKKQIQSKAEGTQDVSKSILSNNLSINLNNIKRTLSNSNDLIIREFTFGKSPSVEAAVVFIDGLSDTKVINDDIINALIYKTSLLDNKDKKSDKIDCIKKSMLSVNFMKEIDTLDEAVDGFLSGDAVLLINESLKALVISCKGWEKRNISEPVTETVIRGPREGFTENLRTNTSLIRKIVKTPDLTIENITLGKKTKTTTSITYIKNIANKELIKDIKNRLQVINTDAILESGYIEEYIEDSPFSIFPTIAYTEKPDVVAAKLLEGRVAIIVDGTPFVLTAPMLFVESFQTAEDYYSRPYFVTFLRWIRFIAFFISILAPAFYVAITTFHQELIPTDLLFTMVAAREGIPFPAVFEAGIMVAAFEILREAGVRLPRPVGQAISIVGALVMGDAAVSAGLVTAPMVIVIAITSVSIFAVPMLSEAGTLLRIILLILAGTMGEFGITIGLLVLLVHMSSLESFGFPYLYPIAPFGLKDNKDTFLRMPIWMMRNRPAGMAENNQTRQEKFYPKSSNMSDSSNAGVGENIEEDK